MQTTFNLYNKSYIRPFKDIETSPRFIRKALYQNYFSFNVTKEVYLQGPVPNCFPFNITKE